MTSDIIQQVSQSVIADNIKEDICRMKEGISRLDKAIEQHQDLNNRRLDMLESDVISIIQMARNLAEDNKKILNILNTLTANANSKDIKSKSSTSKTISSSSHKRKEK